MRLSLYKAYLAITLMNAGDGIINTILPSYLEQAGQSVAGIGFIVSVYSVFALLSRMPAGIVYRPERARLLLGASLAAFALTLALYPLARDASSILLLRGIGGFAFGAATTLNMAAFMDLLVVASNRARAMAFYTAFMSGGFAIGNTVGGWFADSLGYAWAFVLAAVSPFLALLLSTDVMPSEKQKPATISDNQGSVHVLRASLRYIWGSRVLLIVLIAFSLNANHHLVTTFFPLYATSIGLSLTSIGFLRGIHSIFGMATRPLSGEATRIASHAILANSGLALLAVLVALIPNLGSMTAFVPLFIVMGTARGVVMVSNTVSLAEEAGDNPREKGTLSGVFNAARDLGNIAGPILGGVVAENIGIENMLRIGPFIFLAMSYTPFILPLARRLYRRRIAPFDTERR